MKSKILFSKKPVIILGVIILLLIAWYMYTPHKTYQTTTLKGKITAMDNACWFDGVCTITVDNRCRVAIEIGGMSLSGQQEVRGAVNNLNFSNQSYKDAIGKQVEVYGRVLESSVLNSNNQSEGCELSIYGSTSYYVNVL